MILGMGIDLLRTERMMHWIQREGLIQRYFHPQELKEAKSRKKGLAESLAARFSAKEAFGKALGCGLRGFALKEVYVSSSDNGKPEIVVLGKAEELIESAGVKRIHLTLTHELEYVAAVVVLEG
jgi:holo-[acyl-carrier protein] synthase